MREAKEAASLEINNEVGTILRRVWMVLAALAAVVTLGAALKSGRCVAGRLRAAKSRRESAVQKTKGRHEAGLRCLRRAREGPAANHFRCALMSLVISNIDTWALLKISFSLASALIIVRLTLSCRPFFLM